MPELDLFLSSALEKIKAEGTYREIETCIAKGKFIEKNGKKLLSFAGSDYFGLAFHPEIVEIAKNAIDDYGFGATGSRLISGNNPLYNRLEEKLASYHGMEASLVFGTGYMAACGAIPALVGAGDLIIADKLIHACLIDAAKLSGADLVRFAHNNYPKCHELLARYRRKYQKCILVTESIFSMDGDLGAIDALTALAQEYDSWLFIDDAHNLFENSYQKHFKNLVIMGTFSKFLGSYGGYIAGSKILIKYLQNKARSFIYSTALPPAILAATLKAMEMANMEMANEVMRKSRLFTDLMRMRPADSNIIPIIIGDNNRTMKIANKLEDLGIFVKAIRTPTVPPGSARLRVIINYQHDDDDIKNLASAFQSTI